MISANLSQQNELMITPVTQTEAKIPSWASQGLLRVTLWSLKGFYLGPYIYVKMYFK